MKEIFSWSWCSISQKLHGLHNDLLYLSEKMQIEKLEKLVTNLYDKNGYVIPFT